GPVQGARDLAGTAADAVDELPVGYHSRHLVAVRLVAGADDLVEVEDLSRQEHGAVEARGGEPEVEGAIGVLLGAVVLRLEMPDHRVEFQIRELLGLSLGIPLDEARLGAQLPAPKRSFD